MSKIRLWEVFAAIALVGILAAIFLPALARAREGARRSSCQNNLKQMGIIVKMYTNEAKGMYPPTSPVPGNWIFSTAAVYPEYLTDPNILRCPSSAYLNAVTFTLKDNFEHPGARIGSFHPDCVSSLFYIYTGYELLRDDQAQALGEARAVLPEGSFGDSNIQVPAIEKSIEDPVDDVRSQNAPELPAMYLSRVPVVWDRIESKAEVFNHVPAGSNVLYADGHVEFRKYSYYNTPEAFPVTRVAALIFGDSIPQLSRDCYE